MNNLFSESWRRDTDTDSGSGSGRGGGANLDEFFERVEGTKDELKEVDRLHQTLLDSNESLKTLHSAPAVRVLRARMDSDLALALNKTKLIKLRLESLDRSNAANRSAPGCGPGTPTDRARTSLVAGLRNNLKDSMDAFADIRARVAADYREAVARRYYTVTGEPADEATVEALVATGEGEEILARAVREQGRGGVVDVIAEIQERRGAAEEMERGLEELHQVFVDMSVLVASQGQQIDDIEAHVGRASSFVAHGVGELRAARESQKNTCKWTFIAIVVLLVIILIIVLPIVLNK